MSIVNNSHRTFNSSKISVPTVLTTAALSVVNVTNSGTSLPHVSASRMHESQTTKKRLELPEVVSSSKHHLKKFIPTPFGSSHRNEIDFAKSEHSLIQSSNDSSLQPEKAFHPRSKRAFGATKAHNSASALKVPQAVTLYANGTDYCSGTILADNLVLTAAHCVEGEQLSNIKVGIGSSIKAKQIKVAVSEFVIHPQYKPVELVDHDMDSYDYEDDTTDDPTAVDQADTDSFGRPFGSLSLYDSALVKLEENAMKNAIAQGAELAYVKINNQHIISLLAKIKGICESPLTEQQKMEKLGRERFWLVGSGKSTLLSHKDIVIDDYGKNKTVRADHDFSPEHMLSGYLRLKPKCNSLRNTLEFEFNVTSSDMQQFITWCVGDSGGGVYHQTQRGFNHKAHLVGTTRGSDVLSGACVNFQHWREDSSRYMAGHLEATPLDKSVRHFIANATEGSLKHTEVTKEWDAKLPSKKQYRTPKKL